MVWNAFTFATLLEFQGYALVTVTTKTICGKNSEQIWLRLIDRDPYSLYSIFESFADLFAAKDLFIESFCKLDCCFVEDLSLVFDTNNMLHSTFHKNFADHLWLTRGHHDKINLMLRGLELFFELNCAHKDTSALLILKQKIVTLKLRITFHAC